ncbi:unnamed protein product [Closterium sp. Naga37s-1]|nr:unnamed protein product [Closterium sp. Naga37s-1]
MTDRNDQVADFLEMGQIFQRYHCAGRRDGGTMENVVRWNLPAMKYPPLLTTPSTGLMTMKAEFRVLNYSALELQFKREAESSVTINEQLSAFLAPDGHLRHELGLTAQFFARWLQQCLPRDSLIRDGHWPWLSLIPPYSLRITFVGDQILVGRDALTGVLFIFEKGWVLSVLPFSPTLAPAFPFSRPSLSPTLFHSTRSALFPPSPLSPPHSEPYLPPMHLHPSSPPFPTLPFFFPSFPVSFPYKPRWAVFSRATFPPHLSPLSSQLSPPSRCETFLLSSTSRPPSLPIQDKEGASLIVTAEFDVRSGRAIQLQFERAAVGGVKINEQLQALLAPAALPRTQLSLDALQFFRSLELSVPLGFPLRSTTEALSSKQAGRSSLAARAVFDPLHLDAAISTLTSHNFLYAVADAADAAASAAADVSTAVTAVAADAAASGGDAAAAAASDGGWFAGLANVLESILKVLEQGLASVNVPYAYGFSIILLTLLVKVVTFPLTKQQVESTMAMQNLAPKVKAIQTKYAGDQERIQLETSRLYKQAGVNPLAGCLPTLATLPVFIGLYQALSNVAKEGVLTEGFFWIPSLAGPTSIAARDSGSGISWLFPFIDGVPPLGWEATAAYLVLPVLLVASQFYAMQIMQPPQSDDPAQKNTQVILKFLPLMIGWFSLSVPSGLSLYWFTNNLLSTGQTIYLRKMGGATPKVAAGGGDIIDVGQAKRSAASSVVATEQDKEKLRGEQFRKQKETDAARRAAKRAAEEAARAAEEKAAREKARLEQLRAEISGEGEEEVVVVEAEVVPVAGQNGAAAEESKPGVPATPKAAVAPSSGTPRRSRRSRRTRKATPQ